MSAFRLKRRLDIDDPRAGSGTVNDLALVDATDVRALTGAVIIEANRPVAKLQRITDLLSRAPEVGGTG